MSTTLTRLLIPLLTLVAVTIACSGGGTEAPPTSSGNSFTGTTEVTPKPSKAPVLILLPHFVDSYPAHGDTLVQAPTEAVLNVNFILMEGSDVTVTRDGQTVSTGPIVISPDQLSMRASIHGDPGDGEYRVMYRACWPSRACEDGTTSFTVDSSMISEYVDLRGRPEVTVNIDNGPRFVQSRIIVSPGTTVTWQNDHLVDHFVNSAPYPSENALEDLNSSAIPPNENYSYTFNDIGVWGYHCKIHYEFGMRAQIVVK